MATLTQTAYLSRRIIKYGLIGLVALLIGRSIFITFNAYWKKTHPPPVPPPTVRFGKLPKLVFPQRAGLPPIGLRSETISGSFPKFPDRAEVFFVPLSSSNFLAWDESKAWARKLGFTNQPEEIDKNNYRFSTDTNPKTILETNVLTKNFKLFYGWKNDLSLLSSEGVLDEKNALSLAKSYLQTAGVLNDDLLNGPSEAIFYKYKDNNLTKTLFASEANLVKINLFRSALRDLRILPPNPKDSNVSILIAPGVKQGKGIVEVNYIYYPISLQNSSTYPIIDSELAWKQLASGKGFIANLGDNPDGKVTVRTSYIAYYESDTPQSFLQPVVVFEGDNDFYAYVPALTADWVEQ